MANNSEDQMDVWIEMLFWALLLAAAVSFCGWLYFAYKTLDYFPGLHYKDPDLLMVTLPHWVWGVVKYSDVVYAMVKGWACACLAVIFLAAAGALYLGWNPLIGVIVGSACYILHVAHRERRLGRTSAHMEYRGRSRDTMFWGAHAG